VEAAPDSREHAQRSIMSLNAPVDDREVMKAQISKSQLGSWDPSEFAGEPA